MSKTNLPVSGSQVASGSQLAGGSQVDAHGDDGRLGEIVDDVLSALARGEQPDLEHYAQQHPDIADVLQHALPALQAVAESSATHGFSTSPAADPLDKPLSENRRLGDFRIVRELGRGGMGVVYEAEQLSMGRRVAVKVLPFAGLIRGTGLQRFQNEVRAAASLDHPNIVSVYSVGEERGVHYYSMQLIHGQSLSDVLAQLTKIEEKEGELSAESVSQALQGRASSVAATAPTGQWKTEPTGAATTERAEVAQVDVAEVDTVRSTSTLQSAGRNRQYYRSMALLAIQAAEALEHAHQNGVIHRDIKPANLMLDADAKLYVTDFGLARVESDAAVTMTGDIIGTLRYMSPEQALAKRIVIDNRADIYSLGMTLYELLTLRPALEGSNREQLLKQIAFEDPVKPRRIDRSIPADLETIVLKCIEKSPDDRYDTAGELAADLSAFLEDRPIKASPPSAVQRAIKWSRRHSTLVWSASIAASVVIALSITGLLVSNWLIVQQRELAVEQKNEAELQAATSQAVLSFLTDDLFGAADPLNEPDRDIKLRTVVDRAADNAAAQLAEQPLVLAAIRLTLGETYRSLGEFDAAEQQLTTALKLYKRELGATHRTTLDCQRRLANTLLGAGDEVEAEQLLQESLALNLKELGDQHPDTVQCMHDLAKLGLYCGQVVTARRLARHAHLVRSEQLGAEHPLTLESQNLLGVIEVESGDLKRGETHLRSVNVVRLATLGPDHLHTLQSTFSIGVLLASGGRDQEAQSTFKNVRDSAERILAEAHPFRLRCALELALACSRLGDHDECRRLCKAAFAKAERLLGKEHQLTLAIRLALAEDLVRQSKIREAREQLVALREDLEAVFGDFHPLSCTTREQLAKCYEANGQAEEARSLRSENEDHVGRVFHTSFGTLMGHGVLSFRRMQKIKREKEQAEKDERGEREIANLLGKHYGTILFGTQASDTSVGLALDFDGIDDRANVTDAPEFASTESLTISGWITVESFPKHEAGHGVVVMRSDDRAGHDPYFLVTKPEGQISFGITGRDGSAAISTEIPIRERVHIAAVLDDVRGSMTLYVNGKVAAQQNTYVRPIANLVSDRNPGIGVGNHYGMHGHNFPFHGRIEAIDLRTVPLSQVEVNSLLTRPGEAVDEPSPLEGNVAID